MVGVTRVGHVVLRVRDLERSSAFYCDVLGLKEVARGEFGAGPMVFLSTGNAHHDIALVRADEVALGGSLHHVALKVGDSLGELVEMKQVLEANGVKIHVALDHHVSQGLYVSDPDGNLLELYVDADESIWRNDPSTVAAADPLTV